MTLPIAHERAFSAYQQAQAALREVRDLDERLGELRVDLAELVDLLRQAYVVAALPPEGAQARVLERVREEDHHG